MEWCCDTDTCAYKQKPETIQRVRAYSEEFLVSPIGFRPHSDDSESVSQNTERN